MKLISKKLFPNGSLSNEDYHSNEFVSGTLLSKIYSKSVKHAIDTKTKPSDALGFGVACHTAFLEPEIFDKKYAPDLDISDYPDAIKTTADMQKWLSDKGRPKSGTKPQLTERIKETCEVLGEEEPIFFDDLVSSHAKKHQGKTIIKPKDYKQLMNMRNSLFADDFATSIVSGAYVESSILAEIDFYDELNSGEENNGQWVIKCQIRPDIITKSPSIFDYKTTLDASNEKFGIDAYKLGYWLKMAFQRDIFECATGNLLEHVGFIAQEKLAPSQETSPHEHIRYYMTDEQLEEGRKQYLHALKQYADYKRTGIKKGYENRDAILFTPKWAL